MELLSEDREVSGGVVDCIYMDEADVFLAQEYQKETE